ncbi:putative RNA-directed DNA polymerase [Tanacetum coccineum]
MDFRSTPCVFLGYSPSHHGYRCLDISTERLYIARHVCFNEAHFPFDIPKTNSPPPSKTSPYYSLESPYVIHTIDHPSPSSPCSSISSPSLVAHLSPTSQTFDFLMVSPISRIDYIRSQPTTTHTTTTSHHSQRLQIFCKIPKTMGSLQPSVLRPPTTSLNQLIYVAKQLLRWVYRLKRDKNGAITRYKARFVAKGFRQQPDIHNAFLYGNLKEQVYMKQPSGFIDAQRPNHVCLLHKSLYGLKQASRAWFECLSKALFDLGFKGSKKDPYLFIY